MAPVRACCIASVKSALIPRMVLRDTNVCIAGAANADTIAKMATATISSIKEKPEYRFCMSVHHTVVRA